MTTATDMNAGDHARRKLYAKSVALYAAIFLDLEVEVDDQVTEGDRVTSRWTLGGNGKIAEEWTTSDNLTLLSEGALDGSSVEAHRVLVDRLRHRLVRSARVFAQAATEVS
jgi:hypothetical protein